jgi:hypothetical protein
MRKGISVTVTPADRVRLDAIVRDRNSPQKHVWRARIVLLTADGKGTNAITKAAGKDKTAVWRWQERFMREGIQGLTRDKTRPSRIAPLPAETVDRVVALTNQVPPQHRLLEIEPREPTAMQFESIRLGLPSHKAVKALAACPQAAALRLGLGRCRVSCRLIDLTMIWVA